VSSLEAVSSSSFALQHPSDDAPRASDIAAMGLSKSHRIMILLAIDSAFFLLEMVVGRDLMLQTSREYL
jgi:hypothetical protein